MERRRYERVDFFCRVALTIHPSGSTIQAHTIDVSLGGVGVMTQSRFEKGQLVTISFFFRNGSQKEIVDKVLGRVANIKPDFDMKRVGIEFVEPLREPEHRELVKKIMAV